MPDIQPPASPYYNAAKDPNTVALYQAVDTYNNIVARGALTGEEIQWLRLETDNQGDITHMGGISAEQAAALQKKLGLTPGQYQAMIDTFKMKKRYEALPDTPPPGINGSPTRGKSNFWDASQNRQMLQSASTITQGVQGEADKRKAAQEAADKEAADAKARGDNINNQIQGYIDQNTGPVRPGDQIAQSLTSAGSTAAASDAAGRGIQGGLSGASAQAGAQNALAPYLQHREDQRLAGLQALGTRDIQLRQDALSQLQASNQYNATNSNAKAGLFGAIASGVGAVGDTIAGAYGVKTNGAGAQLGAGIGGAAAGYTPMQTTPGYTGYTGNPINTKPGGGIN